MSGTPAVGWAPTPATLWTTWSVDPVFVLALLAAAGLYAWGVANQVRDGGWQSVAPWRAVFFFAGLVLAAIALVSPLDTLSRALLTAHMVQFFLLTVAATGLLVAGAPLGVIRSALDVERLEARIPPTAMARLRDLWAVVTRPAVVAALDAAVLVGWHFPPLYEAAIRVEALHVLMMATFVASGLLFWRLIKQPTAAGRSRHLGLLGAILGTSILGSVYGLVMFTNGVPWYPMYRDTTAAWGITQLDDQEIAAVAVAAPPDTIDTISFLWVVAQWLRKEEEDTIRREREQWVAAGGGQAGA